MWLVATVTEATPLDVTQASLNPPSQLAGSGAWEGDAWAVIPPVVEIYVLDI